MESDKEINMTIPGDMKALGEEAIPENWRRGGQPTDRPITLSSSFTCGLSFWICNSEDEITKFLGELIFHMP